MASRLRICLGLAAALGAVACEASAPAPSTYTVRDSAGVQIVESTAPAWAPDEAWTVSSEPILEIGVIDGPEEYQFTTIGGVWQEDAGTIVVADGRTREIRRYDSEGGFLSRWGGQGDGPGEFRGLISALPYRGDSILAMAGDKHTLFGPEGGLGRSLTYDQYEIGMLGGREVPVRARGVFAGLGDGSWLMTSGPVAIQGDPGTTYMEESAVLHLAADGVAFDTIGVFPGPEMYVPDFANGDGLLSMPFSRSFVFTGDEGGVFVASIEGVEIRRITLNGLLERIIRSSHLDLTTTEADRDGYRAYSRMLAEANNIDRARVERSLLEVEYPETKPPFSQFLVDSEGYLWARHYKTRWSEGSETWSVFAPEGYLLGTVETPERLQVRQIGLDFILGIWTDELDVRYVCKYALERS